MVLEVTVDKNLGAVDLQRCHREPIGINVIGWLPWSALAKEYDVGHHGGSFPFECIRWQADGSDEIGLSSEVLADGRVLFVQREMRCDQCQHAAGLQRVDGF